LLPDETYDPFAIDRQRNRLPERQLAKPHLFSSNRRRPFLRQVVLVEEQEGVVESGAAVDQLIVAAALISQEDVEIRGAQPRRDIGLARLESHGLRIFARHEHEHERIEIRQVIPCAVRFPIVRVPLEGDSLPGQMLLEAKRSQPGEGLRRRSQGPGLRQAAFLVGRFENMMRKHRNAVE